MATWPSGVSPPIHLALVVPGGAPVPVQDFTSAGNGEDAHESDFDLTLNFDRPSLVASIKAGIAAGQIDPAKPLLVNLVSGTHVISGERISLAHSDDRDR